MAYAAYQHASRPVGVCATAFVVVDVVADVSEAAHVRHAASGCDGAGVVRCIPLQHDGRVRLQIRCPACEVAHLMHNVMQEAVAAEFGHTSSWAQHLEAYQKSRHG